MIVHHCQFRLERVDPDNQLVYRRVAGWERKASGSSRRGGSDVVLREPREGFACQFCIDNLKAGRSPSQEALL